MAQKKINYWLKAGKQSRITPEVKKICSSFKGDNLEKISQILEWINKNLHHEPDYDKITKIFASRNIEQLIRDKNQTGCHDTALVLATFLRTVGFPSRYLVGIGKINTENSGHCVVESYIENRWILIDQGDYQINLIPSKSSFYHNYYIVKEGLDSWDCGIKTFADWKKVSKNLSERIKSIY